MIQRIQTLYLMLTAAMMTMMLFFPIGWYVVDGHESSLSAFSLEMVPAGGSEAVQLYNTWGLGVVVVAAALLPLVNIFLYKKRLLQFRLCMSEFALLLGAQALALMFFFRIKGVFMESYQAVVTGQMQLAMFFPIIAIILNWLAQRAIRKDILLVKSLDRIR